ncbi:large conductance mechanosensitive channel protein MscL [Olsenella sp. HMSC062G07]|uniref:large conductance mechanosensitive channel protein MscL n=1 Tax=Olsenella sp. HMSC062G07 TaxID=1739330 RepID=UPI0008A58564|nr:large conductance mechanosensitive channel protein MscL [Olsenella sp. HMSC062G07]OFK23400.1 mechanosensitive ion channel protein MscL [Olsenella sp. HMSC062G07]
MKKFISEFKDFIMRGNVMDMAVGVIIGGAFTAIVTSLTKDVIQPVIAIVSGGGTEVSGLDVTVGANTISFSSFISAIINFLIIAFVVFLMIKGLAKLQDAGRRMRHADDGAQEVPAAPVCPHCLEEVKEGATRCPHCAGEIPGGAHAA